MSQLFFYRYSDIQWNACYELPIKSSSNILSKFMIVVRIFACQKFTVGFLCPYRIEKINAIP